LYTELVYAIIPALFLCFFADLLSLHLVTFLMFFILVIFISAQKLLSNSLKLLLYMVSSPCS